MPQQMSESQEKSDDLIAELAKLMATNAQGGEPKAEQALKMSPLSEATVPSPGPLRIPGMTNPAPAAAPAAAAPEAKLAVAPAAPTIRIPGMGLPVAAAPAPQADPIVAPPVASPAPEPKAGLGPQFDFGKPPSAAPAIAPEPLSNWQTRDVPKPAPASAPVEPVLTVPLKSAPVEPKAAAPVAKPVPAPMPRVEPVAAMPLAAAAAPVVRSPATPSNAPKGDAFDFDFGFGNEPPATSGGSDGDKPAHDPIADLITAELDAAEPVAVRPVEAPKPAPAPAVRPVPVRSFANPNQAPVLVAKPAGTRPAPTPAPMPKASPAPAAAPRTEGDRFAVAPVFGLGSGKPAASPAPTPAPRAEPDPMDEIESLIGEAVRVELSPAEKAPTVTLAPPPPVNKPVVPPLSTSFAPRRTDIKDRGGRDREPPMESAEAAILAAAAATGAQVDRFEGEDRRPVKRMKVKPPKSRGMSGGARQYVGMAVAGTLLLAAGLGLYWVLNMGRADPSTAPVLTAEAAGPTKQPAPVVATTETTEPATAGLFDQMQGNTTAVPTETLVSRDETEGAAATEVARVVGTEAGADTEGGLANRKVRTVTVRPDGTIVPGDEAVAGNEVLPVERPNVPDLPGGSPEPSALLANVEAGTETAATTTGEVNPDAIAAAISGETPVTAEVDPNAVTALVASASPAAEPAPVDPTKVAPLPMARPSDRSTMVGGANRPVELAPAIEAVEPTQLAAAEPAPVSGAPNGAYSQLSSQPTEGDAQSSLRSLQSRYSSLFGGNALEIRRVELGAKGTWYRVVLPTSSFQEATQVCASVKSNGGDCIPNNG